MTAEERELVDLYRELTDKNRRCILAALRGLVMMQELDDEEAARKRSALEVVDGGNVG